ncbi:MAG: PilN domain-containing protein [Candidatus Sulfobium sp.]|jgi:Tfp pilus assembly protein PilN
MTTTQAVKKLSDTASGSVARLKAAWGPLKRVLTFSPADDSVAPQKGLAISLERGGASVVYGSRFLSRIKLKAVKKYFFEEGKYPQPEDIASSLALAANEFGAARTDVTLSIPKAWTIIRTAEFPSTVKENLPDVVFYEIDRLTPFMPDESFFDFQIVKEHGGRLTVLLMAAKAEMVTPYITALREHGFKVGSLTVDLSGMGTLCRYWNKGADTLFVRIDEEGYEGALFIDGSVAQTVFSITPATDREAKASRITEEIKGMMDAAKRQAKNPEIVALFQNEDQSLKDSIKTGLGHPLRILGEDDLGLKFEGAPEEIPYAAVGSLLESLWPGARGLNLIKKGKYETPRTPLALTVVLILAIVAVGILNVMAPLRMEKERVQAVAQQIDMKKKEARKVEALKKEADSLKGEISTISSFKQDNPLTLNLLKELTVILPKTTWLTRVRMTDTTVQIEGYSDSATGLLPKLEASPYLRKVEFASPTFRDRRMNADRFNIKMEIEGPGKAGAEGGKKEIKPGDEKK